MMRDQQSNFCIAWQAFLQLHMYMKKTMNDKNMELAEYNLFDPETQ